MPVMSKSQDNSPPSSLPEGFVDFEVNEGFSKHIGPLYWKLSTNSAELGFHGLGHHLNPGKIYHGGVMMTVADIAIGFAAAWESKLLSFAPSINNNYDFVGAGIADDWLETKTEVVQTTKRMGFARGVPFGSNGPVMRYNGIVKIPSDTNPRFNSKPTAERMQRLFDQSK